MFIDIKLRNKETLCEQIPLEYYHFLQIPQLLALRILNKGKKYPVKSMSKLIIVIGLINTYSEIIPKKQYSQLISKLIYIILLVQKH